MRNVKTLYLGLSSTKIKFIMDCEDKLNTIKKNLREGFLQTAFSISGDELLGDLALKINLQEDILDGIKRRAEDGTIKSEDVEKVIKYWINLRSNLTRALALLEYVDNAIDSDTAELDKSKNTHFPLYEITKEMEESRKRRDKFHKELGLID